MLAAGGRGHQRHQALTMSRKGFFRSWPVAVCRVACGKTVHVKEGRENKSAGHGFPCPALFMGPGIAPPRWRGHPGLLPRLGEFRVPFAVPFA